MGLDMYLERQDRKTGICEDVGYWRKANAINRWFQENCYHGDDEFNCIKVIVTKKNLQELISICKGILNHEISPYVLPRGQGFFFGSTTYDDWYYEDLKDTIKICEDVLKETNFKTHRILYHCWW